MRNYLANDIDISLNLLVRLHSVSKQSISNVVNRYNIPNKFAERLFHGNRPKKEDLQKLYEEHGSANIIGNLLGASHTTVYRWMRNYNIPINESAIVKGKRLRPKDKYLLEMYRTMTQDQIACKIGVSKLTIGNWLKDARSR